MKLRRSLALLLFATVTVACGRMVAEPVGPLGQLATVVGQVETVDIAPMAYDGPADVQMRSEEHGAIHVFVSACMGPCALDAVNALGEMQPGEVWQVTGEVSGDHELAVYDPAAHALVRIGARQ